MAPSPNCCPSPPRPACAQPRQVPMGRERDTGRRSDIRAQRAGMIPCVSSQDLIRLRKLNHSRAFGPVITKIPPSDEVLRRRSPVEGFHSSESVQHPAFYRYRESIPEEMDHREIAVRVPVMNEVQYLFPSEPCKPLKSRHTAEFILHQLPHLSF